MSTFPKISELNKKIKIQRKTVTPNSKGIQNKVQETWYTIGGESNCIWAKWEWISGSEFEVNDTINSKAIAQVQIRFINGLTPDMRIIYKGQVYEIIPPIDDIMEQHNFIKLQVKIYEKGD